MRRITAVECHRKIRLINLMLRKEKDLKELEYLGKKIKILQAKKLPEPLTMPPLSVAELKFVGIEPKQTKSCFDSICSCFSKAKEDKPRPIRSYEVSSDEPQSESSEY